MVHIELLHLLISNPRPANVFGLYNPRWHKYVHMDFPYLPPGIIIVELALVDGVEGRGSEGCSDLSNRHLAMIVDLLYVNMERDELEEGATADGLPPLFHGGDHDLLLGNKPHNCSLRNNVFLPRAFTTLSGQAVLLVDLVNDLVLRPLAFPLGDLGEHSRVKFPCLVVPHLRILLVLFLVLPLGIYLVASPPSLDGHGGGR